MKKLLVVVLVMLAVSSSYAQGRQLSASQTERVKTFKKLITEVDDKTLSKTIAEIERTNDPEMVLQIQETIAKVYAGIVVDQVIKDQPTKQWLYNTVALNMANLQFGGGVGRDPVNRMIVERLKKTLPGGITANPNFHVSVE